MKALVVLLCGLASCSAATFFYTSLPYAPTLYGYSIATPVYTTSSTLFHAQDALGQFTFHHAGDNQSVDGAVRGAYSYVDPTGKLVNVHYLADSNGYRVLGANNLPEAPAVPPEVKAPEPVQDTPEVVAARAAFQKQYDEAAKAAQESMEVSRKKREVVLYPTVYSLLTKSKVKVHEFAPVEDAATPADTKKYEFKEKEHEVYTHQVPVAYSAVPVVNQEVVPSVVSVVNHQVVPTVVESKVKVHEFEPVESAQTPADTKKAEFKEKEQKVLTYSAVVPSTVSVVNHSVPSLVHVPQLVYV
ncbi:hypothetical protein C0J52_07254 [Blattella germanica]|nr:hypothetical protein C0J52_07254 [Blattella germanica]